MAGLKITIKHGAVRAHLRSDAMASKLVRDAKRVAPAHPDITVTAPFKGANRARTQIRAASKPAADLLRKRFHR